jgi:hypothetical protein
VKKMKEQEPKKELELEIEVLEERIAPSIPPGLKGYEGQPGNQGGPNHHP